jgi:hypothetical protein
MYLWTCNSSYHYKYLHKWETMKENKTMINDNLGINYLKGRNGVQIPRRLRDLFCEAGRLVHHVISLLFQSYIYVLCSHIYMIYFKSQKTRKANVMLSFEWHAPHSNILRLFFLISFIRMCIQCLHHLSPLAPSPCLFPRPFPLPSTPLLPGRNCFDLIYNFVDERV